MLTGWKLHLTSKEATRLAKIDKEREALKIERDKMMNRAKVRKHRKSILN